MKQQFKYFVATLLFASLAPLAYGAAVESKVDDEAASVAPKVEPRAGFLPLQLVNNTEFPDNQVFFFLKAQFADSDSVLNLRDGAGAIRPDGIGVMFPVEAGTDLSPFSYRFGETEGLGGRRVVYVPKSYSGRIYFSIGNPVKLGIETAADGRATICDPDGFKLSDANYFTLYDKVEYSYTDDGLWINPTAVDFVGLPIQISLPEDGTPGLKRSGFNKARSKILEEMQTTFGTAPHPEQWHKLFLKFKPDTADETVLRIMAPGKAMEGRPEKEEMFNPDYLQEWIDFVWRHYTKGSTNYLGVNCREIKQGVFVGQVEGADFVFKNSSGIEVRIGKPGSISFFAGAIGTFDPDGANTPKGIIVREFTAAFEVGLLPAPALSTDERKFFDSKGMEAGGVELMSLEKEMADVLYGKDSGQVLKPGDVLLCKLYFEAKKHSKEYFQENAVVKALAVQPSPGAKVYDFYGACL